MTDGLEATAGRTAEPAKGFDQIQTDTLPTAGPEDGESDEELFQRVKSDTKEKLLESYRNGQKADFEPKKSARDEKPRGFFRFRKPGRD